MSNLRKHYLHRAISIGPQVFTCLALQEPSVSDLLRLGREVASASPYEGARAAIAMLARIDPAVIDDKMSPRDFIELSEIAIGMLDEMEKAA